jgi:hypothetical protein
MTPENTKQFYYDLAIKKLPSNIFNFWSTFKITFQLARNKAGYEMLFVRDKVNDQIMGIYSFEESRWMYFFKKDVYSEVDYLKIIKLKAFT